MNLRLRLIVAFFVLSVVPLGAVTFYTYASNAAALREAAGHEAESLAGDLTQRMQLVTTQISERVEHLMDAHRETDAGTATAAEPTAIRSARKTGSISFHEPGQLPVRVRYAANNFRKPSRWSSESSWSKRLRAMSLTFSSADCSYMRV